MREYHKIQSVCKRDLLTHKFIEGKFSLPEFEYLKNNTWLFTEKVDGTNIRVIWDKEKVKFGGKTDNAQMPIFLLDKLQQIFTTEKFKELYPDIPMTLYGEGYGAKIQKGGGNYKSDGVDFVLFDVLIDSWWLSIENIVDVALKLNLLVVPVVNEGTLLDAISLIKTKTLKSKWGNFLVEGLVLKPQIELKSRKGNRIITKLKHKDF